MLIRSPYRADAHEGLAHVSLARGETAKALEQFRTALARSFELEPRIRLAEQIVKLDPKDTATATSLGEALCRRRRNGLPRSASTRLLIAADPAT